MKTVASILEDKGNEIFSVPPDATVYRALEIMADLNVGALVVTEDDQIVGIVSERDYARKVILRERASADTLVAEIMTPDVLTVGPHESVRACMELMTEHRIRHLPVLDGDDFIGVISIGDVVKAVIAELETVVEQLDAYIRSSG